MLGSVRPSVVGRTWGPVDSPSAHTAAVAVGTAAGRTVVAVVGTEAGRTAVAAVGTEVGHTAAVAVGTVAGHTVVAVEHGVLAACTLAVPSAAVLSLLQAACHSRRRISRLRHSGVRSWYRSREPVLLLLVPA